MELKLANFSWNAFSNVLNYFSSNEINEMTRELELLEEQNEVTTDHLNNLTKSYTDIEVTEFWMEEYRVRCKRKKARLEKIQELLRLAREQGHAHSDVLCTLMENQSRLLSDFHDFIVESKEYLNTEYKFSKDRYVSSNVENEHQFESRK